MGERVPAAVAGDLPLPHLLAGWVALAVAAPAGVGDVQADLHRLVLPRFDHLAPGMLLVVGRHLDRDPIPRAERHARAANLVGRHAADIARRRPRLPVAEEDRVIRLVVLHPGPLEPGRSPLSQRRHERPRLGRRLRLGVGRQEQRLLGRADDQPQEEVGHHERLPDGVEPVNLLVGREVADGAAGHVHGHAVAVHVHQFRPLAAAEILAAEVEEIAERVAEFGPVEPPRHRVAAAAMLGGVGIREQSGERVGGGGQLRFARPRLLLRRHLAQVDLVEGVLPDGQHHGIGEVGGEVVEADLVLLRVGAMALVAVTGEERPQVGDLLGHAHGHRVAGHRIGRGERGAGRRGTGGLDQGHERLAIRARRP